MSVARDLVLDWREGGWRYAIPNNLSPRYLRARVRQRLGRRFYLTTQAASKRVWHAYERWAPRGSYRRERTIRTLRIFLAWANNGFFITKFKVYCLHCGTRVNLRQARLNAYDPCPSCNAMVKYDMEAQWEILQVHLEEWQRQILAALAVPPAMVDPRGRTDLNGF